MVIEHIKSICAEIGVNPKDCYGNSDKGGEFGKKAISKILKSYEHVSMGGCVEKKHAQLQAAFYQILKNRQALTIKTALAKTQNLLNKTYSHTHKQTPEEVGQKVKSNEYDAIKGYNDKRKTHISNSKTKELQIGDYVRLQVLGAKVKGVFRLSLYPFIASYSFDLTSFPTSSGVFLCVCEYVLLSRF